MNPPKQVIGIDKGLQIVLTQINNTKAFDTEGNTWNFEKNTWTMDYKQKQKIFKLITMHGYDRDHPFFNTYKQGQILLAEQK